MEGYEDQDAVGLAQLVRDREVTAAELLDVARRRADAVHGRLNAVVRSMDATADAALARAADGPFAGVPFLLKDLGQELAGTISTFGTRAARDHVSTTTDAVTQRWLDAGLVPFGRTNVPEFGAKAVTESLLWGPARNPWDADHTAGGSSGGSAAAVAAGVVPCAGASDGGGSIRIPASCCGLFGLKAGRGVVPAGPEIGEALFGSATDGVVSRSVRDSAAMLDVLAGTTPESPYATATPERPYAEEVGRDPGRLRIGVCTATSLGKGASADAVAAARDAAELLASLGHEVEWLDRPPVDDAALARDFLTGWYAMCADGVRRAKALAGAGDDAFELDTLLMAAIGRSLKATELYASVDARQTHVRALAAFHAGHDLLVTPTTATAPPRVGALDMSAAEAKGAAALLKARAAGLLRHTPLLERSVHQQLSWVPYTQLANLTGRPAMTVPLHRTPAGLPIGTQFVAALGGEGLLLRLAAQLEDARPWSTHRPPLTA